MNFTLRRSERFKQNASNLPDNVRHQMEKCLLFLALNPRHPSLQTHIVKNKIGDYGGPIFEVYVNMQYRLTFEYGPGKHQIALRNIDNHDVCLKHP